MGMHPMTTTTNDEQATPVTRSVSTDLVIGLTLLGVVIVGRLLWALSDGSILSAIGAR
jgi:hypothetical protein